MATALPITTATILDVQQVATGTNEKGDWAIQQVILASEDGSSGIVAETFLPVPAVGSTVRVMTQDDRRIVGNKVFENTKIVRFIPVG